ncbi:hypothetical protein [Endozoicomonas sp. SCSIO W0465]|uniref:hypothetical protein n=1 Tax=Endozoicomonas sp. SCSIO W0465 TaxID=2918516 RepID=UPI002075F036|nr:hypothetical protein [Endozoicomonas sp. SCSIO W0465]USE37707.1 hypothetical protein MJO57_05775 [Endozoicomonas sp. SCSIO W0465]
MQPNTSVSSSPLLPLLAESSPDVGQPLGRKASKSGRFADCQSMALAGGRNQFPKPDHTSTNEAGTKSTDLYQITSVNENQLKQVEELKNRFYKNNLKTLGHEMIMEGLKLFVKDDYLSILKLASHQDNNECYFDQLKASELPSGLHTLGHEEDLRIYQSLENKDSPEEYQLCKEMLLKEAIGKSRLRKEFGVKFTLSSMWLDPVADKLRSLGCKTGIEVMAGKGYLSYFLINTYGFKMRASDRTVSYQRSDAASPAGFIRKENPCKTVKAFKDTADFLVISWPPRATPPPSPEELLAPPVDYQVLVSWGVEKPVLFVGERPNKDGKNLSTGSHSFHYHLNTYFTACKFPQYHGRYVGALDEAIIFIPNGKSQ